MAFALRTLRTLRTAGARRAVSRAAARRPAAAASAAAAAALPRASVRYTTSVPEAAAEPTAAEREQQLAEEVSRPADRTREVFDAIWASEEDAYVRATQRSSYGGRAVARLPAHVLQRVTAKGWERGQDLSGVDEDKLRLRLHEEDAPEEGDVLRRVLSYDTASQMEINRARVDAVVESYRRHANDTGSTEVQIAVLTQKLLYGEAHMRQHPKDHHSRRGVDAWRTQRRKLLRYLKRSDHERFEAICVKLGLPVKRAETRDDLDRQRQRRQDDLRRKVGTPSRSMKKRLNIIKRKQERERARMLKKVGASI